MRLYQEMAAQHWRDDVIVLPENAIPAYAHSIKQSYLEPLGQQALATDTAMLIGIPILDLQSEQYYNGMVVIGAGSGEYRKHHLVPFGEYIPLQSIIGNLLSIMQIPMSEFSAGETRQALLKVKEYDVGVTICYEDAFPEELIAHLPQAHFLVNASNNAWYGDSLAPHQHLQIAQMRAIETARYIVRATTNGISAIIDHRGHIQTRTPQFAQAAITGTIQARTGSTPYVMFGNYLILLVILLSVLIAHWESLRKALLPALFRRDI